ncbi:MAG: ATPase, T2SS/T4P/T4SS family [Thermoleophilaceae bacterium]
MDDLAEALRGRLIERARAGGPAAGDVRVQVRELVDSEAPALTGSERESLCERVLRLAGGLGPLEPLLADPLVDEVMVNGPDHVYVERRGKVVPTAVRFGSESDLTHAIERILAPLGRRVDEASPMCDARLADGSRVNVVVRPLSLVGPCLTIRRFRREGYSLRDLVANGTLATAASELLALAVAGRASILVSGGTGSGKTTTLNALSGAIPAGERVVTIEDAAELSLRQEHVVRLESRPANLEGRGGDDPQPGGQRPADAARPDSGGRGSGPRGARSAPGAEHGPRRLAEHRARQLARGRAEAAGDAGPDGRGGPAPRRDPRAGGRRAGPGGAPDPATRRLASGRVDLRGDPGGRGAATRELMRGDEVMAAREGSLARRLQGIRG